MDVRYFGTMMHVENPVGFFGEDFLREGPIRSTMSLNGRMGQNLSMCFSYDLFLYWCFLTVVSSFFSVIVASYFGFQNPKPHI